MKREIENNINLPLKVPVKLSDPDVLIIQAKKKLLADKPHSFHKFLVSTGSDELSISVSPENIQRSLLFMDTLIKLIRARGHNIVIKGYATYAIIYDEQFEISLREKVKRMPDNNWGNRYQPTGELIFSFRVGRLQTMELNDGKNILIEHKLSAILAKLEIKSKEEKAQRISIEKYWKILGKRSESNVNLKKDVKKNYLILKKILSDAKRWHESNMLRNYLNSLEDNSFENELKGKIKWAREKADWYDPTVNANDEILQNIDPNSIFNKV